MIHEAATTTAAKSDVQAVRLVMALSSASPATLQTHGSQPTALKALGAPLAKLMTKPSIKQQLQLLKMIMPHLFEGSAMAIATTRRS